MAKTVQAIGMVLCMVLAIVSQIYSSDINDLFQIDASSPIDTSAPLVGLQTNEAWFTHTPGLKVVYPAFPFDAKGLLISSIEDPNPVMFFEHKALYRSISQPVSEDCFTIEIGKANLIKEGSEVTIVTYGIGVHWALEVLKNNKLKTKIPKSFFILSTLSNTVILIYFNS